MCGDHLIGGSAFDLIRHVWGQFRIVSVQSGNYRRLCSYFQGPVFVRDVVRGRHVRRDNQSPVDEHRVGHVLRHANAYGVEEFHIANSTLYRNGHISNCRIQSDIFNFTQKPKQILHLVLRGLRSYVGDLDHFRNRRRRMVVLRRHLLQRTRSKVNS